MKVKELADLTGTTVRTVRYYHQLGLLSVPPTGAGWRSYGFAHLTRLMRIRWLVESGVPLDDVPHMVRRPVGDDERTVVLDDLHAVLGSIDERIGVLRSQRARVETLIARVTEHGRLSPLPPSLVDLYAALLARPLSPAVLEAVTKERDLLELLAYRDALPADLLTLVAALSENDITRLCDLWEEVHRLDQEAGDVLTDSLRSRVDDVADQTVAAAEQADPGSTHRLLDRAARLDRSRARAVLDLAFPSPVYREFLHHVAALVDKGVVA
mgnify:CR=1 FL=1